MLLGRLSQIVRHPAAWLAVCAPATAVAAARANTRPIITTTGPPTVVAARRCGKSAMDARMTVSSGRVALITATAGVAASRPAAIPAAPSVSAGMLTRGGGAGGGGL